MQGTQVFSKDLYPRQFNLPASQGDVFPSFGLQISWFFDNSWLRKTVTRQTERPQLPDEVTPQLFGVFAAQIEAQVFPDQKFRQPVQVAVAEQVVRVHVKVLQVTH